MNKQKGGRYMDERKDNFPVNISFTVERNQKTGLPFIAEK